MANPDELFGLVADGLLTARRRIAAIPDERARADMERRLTAVSNAAKHDLATAWRRLSALLVALDPPSGAAPHSASEQPSGGEYRPEPGKNAAG